MELEFEMKDQKQWHILVFNFKLQIFLLLLAALPPLIIILFHWQFFWVICSLLPSVLQSHGMLVTTLFLFLLVLNISVNKLYFFRFCGVTKTPPERGSERVICCFQITMEIILCYFRWHVFWMVSKI